MICSSCGCTDQDQLRRDADVTWDKDAQDWRLCAVYDSNTCHACGDTDCLEEEPLERQGVAYWVIHIVDDVDPVVHGPHKSADEQLAAARRIRRQDTNDVPDGLYWLDVDEEGTIECGPFTGGLLEGGGDK